MYNSAQLWKNGRETKNKNGWVCCWCGWVGTVITRPCLHRPPTLSSVTITRKLLKPYKHCNSRRKWRWSRTGFTLGKNVLKQKDERLALRSYCITHVIPGLAHPIILSDTTPIYLCSLVSVGSALLTVHSHVCILALPLSTIRVHKLKMDYESWSIHLPHTRQLPEYQHQYLTMMFVVYSIHHEHCTRQRGFHASSYAHTWNKKGNRR